MLAFLCLSQACGTVTAAESRFDDIEELANAARLAKAGDVLVLQAGSYELEHAVTFASGQGGDVDHPVTIKAETIGGCVLSGESTAFAFKPGASHVVVLGFVFELQDETAVKIDGSHHIRVTQCSFKLNETDSFDWLVITGKNSHHNRVDRCVFSDKQQPGNFITIDGDSDGLQQSQYDRIDHNLFQDVAPRAKNEKEAIRVGWSEVSLSSGFTILEHNYFRRCDGDPEIVSVKSCDNTIRHNTIFDSMGTLSLRHGNRNSVYGNAIIGGGREGCGGIRVYGDDHRIYNNYLANLTGERFDAALAITNGDADDAKPGARLSAHFRPRRIEVVNNSFINNAHSVEIGYTKQGKKQWRKTPREILFVNNIITARQGELVKLFTAPERSLWKNNLLWPSESATVGAGFDTPDQVADPKLVPWRDFLVPSSENEFVGLACGYVSHDFLGATRRSPPGIGAIEGKPVGTVEAPLQPTNVGPLTAEADLQPHAVIDPASSLRKSLQH